MLKNLRYCFPEKSNQQIQELCKRYYHWMADLFMEIIHGYRASDEEMRQRVRFIHTDEAQDEFIRAGGSICMLGHMGCWEWIADIGKQFRPEIHANIVYLKLKSKSADKAFIELRKKRGTEPIEMHRLIREMARRSGGKRVEAYCMLADQKPAPQSLNFQADFFGHPTHFMTGADRLSRRYDYPVVYVHITMPQRGYYEIYPEVITYHPSTTPEGFITREYARLLEQNIRQQPEIWLWTHNRFKWNPDYK